MPQFIALALLGLAAGSLGGLLGVGGGVIIVPALTYLLHVPIHIAVGTSLAVIIPTAITGSLTHFTKGNVDLRAAVLVAAGSIVGAYAGATLAEYLPAVIIKRLFGVLLAVMAIRLLISR
ncbi:MAG TPA: sulfite exporter TauE/SafE family protein [Limnochordia bacterium]